MSMIKTAVVASTAAGVLAATIATASAAPAPTQPRRVVHMQVTSKNVVAAPATTQPGIAGLRNTGASEIFVFQQKKAGVATLVKDLNAQANSAGPGRLIKDFTLLTVSEPGHEVFVPVARGTVFLVDAELDHFKAAEVSAVGVSGARADAVVPASVPITVDSGNLLHTPKTLPSTTFLHLRSRSSALQEIWLVEVGKQVSTATLKDFIAHPSLDKISDISPKGQIVFFGLVAGHGSVWQRAHSVAGRDVVLNFPLRPTTGEPTLHQGQARVVTVG
jgi:hypothetical protein